MDGEPSPKPPIVTLLLMLVLLVLFIFTGSDDSPRQDTLALLGLYYFSFPIWDGAYSSLLMAPLVHGGLLGPIHLVFDVVMIFVLGRHVEEALGPRMLFGVAFFAAIAGSGAQLAVGGWPYLGSTGVVFALFGLMVGARPAVPLFERVMTPRWTLLMALILSLTVPISLLDLMPIGNAADAAGMLLGYAAALCFVRRQPLLGAAPLACLLALTILSLTWMPWNGAWKAWDFIRRHYGEPTKLSGTELADVETIGELGDMNDDAWTKAASPRPADRDARRAVDLAQRVCATLDWTEPSHLDTLAAAYAEANMWPEALVTQQVAVMVADGLPDPAAGDDGPTSAALRQIRRDLHDHLASIEEHRKIRDETLVRKDDATSATLKTSQQD